MNSNNSIPQTQVEIKKTLNHILERGQVAELRAIKVADRGRPHTVAGYFNDWDKMAKAAVSLDGKAMGIYMTLNPVSEALLSRYNNRLQKYPEQTTSDHDITRYRWFPVDIDAKRPAGISSTEEEYQAALKKAKEVKAWLQGRGWPEPVEGDSGNGAHLLYRVDLPNNKDTADLLSKALEALAVRFDDNNTTIDTSVFNASRIWKLYGTLVRKGDNTEDRPHRRAKMLVVPEDLEQVTNEQLEALAKRVPQQENKRTYRQNREMLGDPEPLDIQDFMARHNIRVYREKPFQDGTLYQLAECPWNPDHRNGDAYIIQFGNGALSFSCFHNSCQQYAWRDLREKLEPGCYDYNMSREEAAATVHPLPKTDPERNGDPEEWPDPIPFTNIDIEPLPADILPDWVQDYVLSLANEIFDPLHRRSGIYDNQTAFNRNRIRPDL